MLQRHRHRQYLAGNNDTRKPALLVRLSIGAVILLIIWFLASKAINFFDGSVARKTAAILSTGHSDSVQVSLQEEDWQRGENDLKLYAGDAVATRGSGDAMLKFFDGTKIRLDVGTDVMIVDSKNEQEGTSSISVHVRSGRIWIVTPELHSFSGAILRTVKTSSYSAEAPHSTHALLSSGLINVMRASGVGIKVSMNVKKTQSELFVGEGQYVSLSEESLRLIEDGADPYDFRDPVTLELLRDEFLISSFQMKDTNSDGPVEPTLVPNNEKPLVLLSPENYAQINAKTVAVTGKVSPRITQITINGQKIAIKPDFSFSADLSLPPDKPTFLITVEAEDAQGVPVAKIERSISNTFTVLVEPVRIKSPVGSGETLQISQPEIEITGEVSSGIAGVTVNDYRLQLFKIGSKTWSYLASTKLGNMSPGTNTYTVRAIDADGNVSVPRSITIIYAPGAPSGSGSGSAAASQPALKQNPPLTPGVLTVEKPSPGISATIREKEIVLEGRTSAETASISINGYTLSLYLSGKTTWNYIASTELGTMKRGKNVYRIVARNAGGEILDVLEYTITFNP